MKRLVILALALLATGACNDDPTAPLPPGTGPFEGLWDGQKWRGHGYAVLVQDTLFLMGHRGEGRNQYDEYVHVRIEFHGPALYAIEREEGRLEQVTGGDAGYFPQASGEVSLESLGVRVEGAVALTADGPGGETWEFRDGRFDLPVYPGFDAVPTVHGS